MGLDGCLQLGNGASMELLVHLWPPSSQPLLPTRRLSCPRMLSS
jgi:hypothetical protein